MIIIFVIYLLSSQDSKDAEQYFPLATNHSCWDWVRKREYKVRRIGATEQRDRQRQKESGETKDIGF